jgi:FAD/FMN-containing dehydrogenase
MTPDQIRQSLRDMLGTSGCPDLADTEAYTTDYRRIYRGEALAIVLPESTEQVSQVMAWCYERGIPVIPQGGNTSLMGGAVPEAGTPTVMLNLRRMGRLIELDEVNDTMTVQAGMTLNAARTAAETAGRLFPLRIGSEGSCQIGGNISTNAGGTAVLRYGNMRELVLGIEAVLPDGRIYRGLRGLRKDNTGYDLKQLFIGSEGTLGIVTAAVLKLQPLPAASSVAFVAVSDPAAAVALLGEAKKRAGPEVTAFELISRPALDLVLGYLGNVKSPLAESHDWMVLIELTSGSSQERLDETMQQILEAGMEQGWVQDAALAASVADAQTFWRIREEISDAQTRTRGSIRCDVSVPLSRIPAFVADATAAVLAIEPRTRMVIYGHMGDGNVHFNPLRPADVSADDYLAQYYRPVSDAVDQLAQKASGSISAEHGVGVAKRQDMLEYKSRVELELMWQVKRALDPKNLLNPNKVLPQLG